MMCRSDVSIVAAALLALAPARGVAQPAVAIPPRPLPAEGRLALEGFVSRYRLAVDGAGRTHLPAFGGRMLWALGRSAIDSASMAARIAVGPFVSHAATDDGRPEVWHYGVHSDVRLLARPAAGLVDPLLTLGVGRLRTVQQERQMPVTLPMWRAGHWLTPGPNRMHMLPQPVEERVTTRLALSPGLGARISVGQGLALRTDLRDVLLPRAPQRHNLELSGGVSLTL
jgi:hypothetical protein